MFEMACIFNLNLWTKIYDKKELGIQLSISLHEEKGSKLPYPLERKRLSCLKEQYPSKNNFLWGISSWMFDKKIYG